MEHPGVVIAYMRTPALATAVSDDGLTIVGRGNSPAGPPEGWIAHIPEPSALSLLLLDGIAAFRRRR